MKTANPVTSQGICPNCGAESTTQYCGACGQPQAPLVLPAGAWLRDAFQEMVSVDGRFLVTLRLLLFSPGKLESEWLQGRRRNYMSPTRLYLILAAFLFFSSSLVPAQTNPLTSFATGVIASVYDGNVISDGGSDEESVVGSVSHWVSVSTKWIMMFGMVPALAFLTKILLGKRRDYYATHLVVSLHFHAVLFLCLGLILVSLKVSGRGSTPDIAELYGISIVLPIMAVYSFILFRRVFKRGWISTIARFCLVLVAYTSVVFIVASSMSLVALKSAS